MTCESVACWSYFTNKSVRDVCALRDLWYLCAMCVRASMKAAKPLHIVLATNPNPTRARGYPLNINPKPDPKPDSISGPAGSGRVADLYSGGPKGQSSGTEGLQGGALSGDPWQIGELGWPWWVGELWRPWQIQGLRRPWRDHLWGRGPGPSPRPGLYSYSHSTK